jgi:hypothetical protein
VEKWLRETKVFPVVAPMRSQKLVIQDQIKPGRILELSFEEYFGTTEEGMDLGKAISRPGVSMTLQM